MAEKQKSQKPNRKTRSTNSIFGEIGQNTLNLLDLQTEVMEKDSLIKQLDTEIEKLKETDKANKEVIADLKQEKSALDKEIINLNKTIKENDKEIKEMGKQIKKQTTVINEKEQQIQTKEQEFSALEEKLKRFEEKEQELKQKEEELAKANKRVQEIQEKLNKQQETTERAKEEVEQLKQQNEELKIQQEQQIEEAKEQVRLEIEQEIEEEARQQFMEEFYRNEKAFFINVARLLDLPLNTFNIRSEFTNNDDANTCLIYNVITTVTNRLADLSDKLQQKEIVVFHDLLAQLNIPEEVILTTYNTLSKLSRSSINGVKNLCSVIKYNLLEEDVRGERTNDEFIEYLNNIYEVGSKVDVEKIKENNLTIGGEEIMTTNKENTLMVTETEIDNGDAMVMAEPTEEVQPIEEDEEAKKEEESKMLEEAKRQQKEYLRKQEEARKLEDAIRQQKAYLERLKKQEERERARRQQEAKRQQEEYLKQEEAKRQQAEYLRKEEAKRQQEEYLRKEALRREREDKARQEAARKERERKQAEKAKSESKVVEVKDYSVKNLKPKMNELHFKIACQQFAKNVIAAFDLKKSLYYDLLKITNRKYDDNYVFDAQYKAIDKHLNKMAKKQDDSLNVYTYGILTQRLHLTDMEALAVLTVFERLGKLKTIKAIDVKDISMEEFKKIYTINGATPEDQENEVKYKLAEIFERTNSEYKINESTGFINRDMNNVINADLEAAYQALEKGVVGRSYDTMKTKFDNSKVGVAKSIVTSDIKSAYYKARNKFDNIRYR